VADTTLLAVDDEPDNLELIRRVAEAAELPVRLSMGHDGLEAVARVPGQGSRFAFRLPLIAGPGSLPPETRQFLAQTRVPWLSKPFALEELGGCVRRIPPNPAVDEARAR
jgi:hypothetical protein